MFALHGGGLRLLSVRLGGKAFDLCLTAGPGEDFSVGSCGCLISPVLTQAQLIDGALWDSARKLSGPCQINHRRGIHSGYLKLQPQWPFSSLFAYSELHKGNDFYSIEAHRGSA